ncbi:hypothetical protein TNCV_4566641 [Trichonephila clavipes]|nr:hypothetical protein TNCV_4566641 [Trichonephila clavipes]
MGSEDQTRGKLYYSSPKTFKTLEEDLKQQLVYQDSPKDALSDLNLETKLAIPFAQTKTLKIFLNNYSLCRVVGGLDLPLSAGEDAECVNVP